MTHSELTSADDDWFFECEHCSKHFRPLLFGLSKMVERVVLAELKIPTVEVLSGETIANFCSDECAQAEINNVLSRHGVPRPTVPPGIEPIEICARCRGPIDTSQWYTNYTYSEEDHTLRHAVKVLDINYLAYVCRKCSGDATGAERSKAGAMASVEDPAEWPVTQLVG